MFFKSRWWNTPKRILNCYSIIFPLFCTLRTHFYSPYDCWAPIFIFLWGYDHLTIFTCLYQKLLVQKEKQWASRMRSFSSVQCQQTRCSSSSFVKCSSRGQSFVCFSVSSSFSWHTHLMWPAIPKVSVLISLWIWVICDFTFGLYFSIRRLDSQCEVMALEWIGVFVEE